jgi:hypothetical protein
MRLKVIGRMRIKLLFQTSAHAIGPDRAVEDKWKSLNTFHVAEIALQYLESDFEFSVTESVAP